MTGVQLFALIASGAQPVQLAQMPQAIHDLPEDLPFGVYTSFRTFDHNKFLGLDDHLLRLQQSVDLMSWQYDLDTGRLRQMLHEVCTGYDHADARVRIDVLSEPAPQLPDASRELITLAPFTPIPARHYEQGVRLGFAPDLHRSLPRAKTADFILARNAHPGDPKFFDSLLLDGSGAILEACTSNFYAVKDSTLWTAQDNVLEGITRKIVLRLASQLGIRLRLEAIPVTAISDCEEAFISSSSRGLVPVVAIGDEMVGNGQPGSITLRLMRAYNAYVAQAIRLAIE